MVNIPLLPFNISIKLDDNVYKQCQINKSDDNQPVNVEYIKIQLILQISKHKISLKKLNEDIKLIDKDIERTSYLKELENHNIFDEKSRERIKDSLRNVLITFAAFNQNLNQTGQENNSLGYTQGYFKSYYLFLSILNLSFDLFYLKNE
jgi:hypothetical protein